LAWVLRERDDKVQAVTSALIGASRPQQIIENVAALEHLKFTDEELIKIEKLL
jgi:L-glyceraldehyde 3-phosphate reductase